MSPYTLLAAHNTERVLKGLGTLLINPKLQAMAQTHANTMAGNQIEDHNAAGDGTFQQRLNTSGYAYASGGENIAKEYTSIPEVMTAWMNSPLHRANVLGDWADMGAAVGHADNGSPYWCTVFGKPA